MLHPDLLDVKRLEAIDSRIDKSIASITELEDGVRQAVTAYKQTHAMLAELQAKHVEAKAEERRLDRKMHTYRKRRDDTRELIDTGRAPDFLVAQRQHDQCAEIVDETEFALLEQMELREDLDKRIALQKRACTQAEHQLGVARKSRDEGRPPLESLVRSLRPERKLVHADLPVDLRDPYNSLRRQRKPILTHLRAGICVNCHIQARAQVAIEVERQRAAHRCAGCNAWFLGVLDEPEEEEG